VGNKFIFYEKTMTNLTEKITDITIGIRFQRSFRIKDVLGAITDKLVYFENSPLNEYFERQTQNGSEMILTNEKGSYLRVNTDDIIFKHVIEKSIDEELEFLKNYLKYIKNIIKKYNITNVVRIGIIYNHTIKENQKKFTSAISSLTNNQLDDVDDFSISFSKKISATSGVIKKGVNDYQNVIYLFRKISDQDLAIGLDFQKYFAPPLDEIEDKDFEDFLSTSKQYLENTFYNNFLEQHEEK
jgi:hypothetical protein